ncbi:MAG: hypothetical protein ACR2M6_03955 [Vampirovibrionia bacterium]|jgi:hypothetical protein
MALTSIRNEPCRIKKELQQMTDMGRYQITAPGPGANVGFAEDPHIRLQKWGANLRTNTINTESDLMGLTRSLTRDCVPLNQYQTMKTPNEKLNYGTIEATTEETRAINPAWTVLDEENKRWDYIHHNPQLPIMMSPVKYGGNSSRIDQKTQYNHFVKNMN